jgi:hypothetical protein
MRDDGDKGFGELVPLGLPFPLNDISVTSDKGAIPVPVPIF